ncbi:MAG: VCBS repeat-containing protein, partial [Planctomycetota bacterium]
MMHARLTPVLLVAVATSAAAQFQTSVDVDPSLASGAQRLRVEDWNQDGLNDVLFIAGTNLGWIERRADGSFGEPEVLANVNGAQGRVELVDLDGDGDEDLFFVESSGLPFALFRDGMTYSEPVSLSSSPIRFGTTFGDLEGDGDLDLFFTFITTFTGPTFLGVYPNDGAGNLGPAIDIPLLPQETFFLTGASDLNGDGAADLQFAVDEPSTLLSSAQISINDGQGGFAPAVETASTGTLYEAWSYGDVNGDSFPDFVGHDPSAQAIDVLLNSGAAAFTPFSSTPNTLAGLRVLTLADLDADGAVDILARDFLSAKAYPGDGAGGFGQERELSTAGGSIGNVSITLGDLTQDGRPEVVTFPSVTNVTLAYFPSLGFAGGSPYGDPVDIVVRGGRSLLLVRADLNGDGAPEVVGGQDLTPLTVTIFESRLNGPVAGRVARFFRPIDDGSLLFRIAAGDVDGDSRDDLLSVTQDQELFLTRSLPAGTAQYAFDGPVLLGPCSRLVEPLVADVDDDGDLDVLGVSVSFRELLLYENVGGVLLPAATIYTSDRRIRHLDAADIDGNGTTDLVTGERNGDNPGRVRWIPGLGGAFGAPVTIASSQNTAVVRAADLDGDGLTDVAWGFQTGNTIAWGRNLGSTFAAPAQLFTIGQFVEDIDLADVDDDGDIDAVVRLRNSVRFAENAGGGSFPTSVALATVTRSSLLIDLEGDGDLDLMASGRD